jgi:hypothetical protein
MSTVKKKPQIRMTKILDVGTENKFVARLTIQMFDLLECSSLEENQCDKVKEILFGLMNLFLRNEKWIREFSKQEAAFFEKMPTKDSADKFSVNFQDSLSKLNQLSRAFFLNLNLAIIQGVCNIAGIILNKDIKGIDNLSSAIATLSAEGRIRFTKNIKDIKECTDVFHQYVFKPDLSTDNIHQTSAGKHYLSYSSSGRSIISEMEAGLDRCFEHAEGLIVDLIATICPSDLEIYIDETCSIKNKKYIIPGLRNEFWLPYFGYYWWESVSEKDKIRESENNKAERNFYLNVFLERIETRKINDSAVALLEEKVVHMQMPLDSMDIKLSKNDENRLRMISCKIRSIDRNDAIRKGYNIVARLLSYQTFVYASSSCIFAMRISDEFNQATWECKPQSTEPAPLYFPSIVGVSKELDVLLSIYRDAKNTFSPFYRFLCYYKILEAFYEHRHVFSDADTVIKKNNLCISRPRRSITKAMVIKSMLHHRMNEFIGKAYGKYFEYLRSNERIMVAHVFPSDKTKEIADLNDYDLYSEFVSLGNLTELIARDILFDELNLWQQINKLLPEEQPKVRGTPLKL